MESRELLSGLLPSLNTRTSEFAPRDVTDALHKATTHDIRQVDLRLGAPMPEARAQHALGKLQGERHANVIAGPVRSGGASSKAVPVDDTVQLFKDAAFSVKINQVDYAAEFKPRQTLGTKSPNIWNLTETSPSLPRGFSGQVFDLYFQNGSGLLGGNKPPKSLDIQISKVKLTQLVAYKEIYFYYTTGPDNTPVTGIHSAKDLKSITVGKAPTGDFDVFDVPISPKTGTTVFVSLSLPSYKTNLESLGVNPATVTGIHFGVWATTPA